MLWKLGWLVNSLKYRAEKEIRDTLYKNNKVFLRNNWSRSERIVVWGAKHVFIANLGFFLIASAFFFVIAEHYTLIQTLFQTLSGMDSLVEFQSTIFGIQVTLLGLIFPLVIAFIGILLKGLSSNDSMWVIYRNYSGFMLVGSSTLTWSLSFVLLKLFEPWLTHELLVAASISTTAWFLTNMVLFVRFIWKTVDFLSLNSRNTMVVKYAINEAVPSDIKNRLLGHYSLSAIKTGLLLDPKDDSLKVNLFSFDYLEERIVHQFSKPRRINNVWYRILNLGVWFFSRHIKTQKAGDSPVTLSFPFSVSHSLEMEHLLAKTNCNSVNWISKVLIKCAVKTTAKPVEGQLNVKQIIGALFGQLEDALKDNNFRQFDSAHENLIQFQRDLESSMFFMNDNDEPDNWLFLSEGWFLGRNFLDVFVEESCDIAKNVTRRIPDDSKYYESWCYLYPHLFRTQEENITKEVAVKYVDGHFLIWEELMIWMDGFDKNNIVSAQQKDRAINDFVVSWEHWRILLDNDFESVKSKDLLIASHHLNNSCCMIVYACKYNNTDAAFWATDVLTDWFKNFSNRNIGCLYTRWKHELISISALELDCEQSLLESLTCNYKFSKVEAATIALRNYWIDLRYCTAAYLLATSHNDEKKENEYKNLIKALMSGNRLEQSGHNNNHSPPNVKDILGAFLRHHGSWKSQSNYRGLMEHLIGGLAKIEEPEWVHGRNHDSFPTMRAPSLQNFFKVMGIGLTIDEFKIDQKWLEFLKSNSISEDDLKDTISSLELLTEVDVSTIESVSEYFEIGLEESKEKSKIFVDSIKGIIKELKPTILTKIRNASRYQDRLLQLGVAASASTFTLSDGPIPVSLFDDIDYRDDYHCALVVKEIADYGKSDVTQEVGVNRANDENKRLKNTVSEQLQATCFHQLLEHSRWAGVEFEDAKSLILRAVEDSHFIKNKSLTPIMFISPGNVYKLLRYSRWEYWRKDVKLPFDITVESNKSNDYICHVDGIEIYRLPLSKRGVSVLFSKESLKKINVSHFGDGRYVDAIFKTENDTDLTGMLSLAFGVECEFNKTDAIRYISRNPDE